MSEEPCQAFERALAQPLALGREPVFVRRGLLAQAGQQIAAMVRQGVPELIERRVAHRALEQRGVDVDARRIEGHGVAIEAQRVGERVGLPHREQHLAEVRARGPQLGPQQSRELVPRMGRPGGQGEECEERLGFSPGHVDRLPRPALGTEAAEKLQDQAFHAAETSAEGLTQRGLGKGQAGRMSIAMARGASAGCSPWAGCV